MGRGSLEPRPHCPSPMEAAGQAQRCPLSLTVLSQLPPKLGDTQGQLGRATRGSAQLLCSRDRPQP